MLLLFFIIIIFIPPLDTCWKIWREEYHTPLIRNRRIIFFYHFPIRQLLSASSSSAAIVVVEKEIELKSRVLNPSSFKHSSLVRVCNHQWYHNNWIISITRRQQPPPPPLQNRNRNRNRRLRDEKSIAARINDARLHLPEKKNEEDEESNDFNERHKYNANELQCFSCFSSLTCIQFIWFINQVHFDYQQWLIILYHLLSTYPSLSSSLIIINRILLIIKLSSTSFNHLALNNELNLVVEVWLKKNKKKKPTYSLRHTRTRRVREKRSAIPLLSWTS